MFFHSFRDVVFSWGLGLFKRNLCMIVLGEGEAIKNFSHAMPLANQPVNPINKDLPRLLLQSLHHSCDVMLSSHPLSWSFTLSSGHHHVDVTLWKVQAVYSTFHYVDAVYHGEYGHMTIWTVVLHSECFGTHFVDASMKFLRGFCSALH